MEPEIHIATNLCCPKHRHSNEVLGGNFDPRGGFDDGGAFVAQQVQNERVRCPQPGHELGRQREGLHGRQVIRKAQSGLFPRHFEVHVEGNGLVFENIPTKKN